MSDYVVEIEHIAKRFGQTQAVQDVSFAVQRGEIFGLLGPNGAGKTTTIRMMLDIFKPDQGRIVILGGPMDEAKKARIGYMPEERGLYQDMPLERCLLYMARLKGLTAHEAQKRLDDYLERFDLAEHRKKKVKELSKGMQQKAQLIATFIHAPDLLIVDEPFSGLDPVNTRLVQDMMRDLRDRGATILMSTHQMHLVEELCDRLLLINRGTGILYGPITEVRRRYMGNEVLVQTHAPVPDWPDLIAAREAQNGSLRLTLRPGVTPQALLKALVQADIPIEHFEIALPHLDDIFIQVVQEGETA